jgi:hypothetical protein
MPWSTLANNQTISFANLQNAINTGVFQQKAAIPVESSEQITKADANTYVNINTGYAPYANKASNQLVVKSDLQSGISAPYEWTFWYQSCCSGCIDPEVRLQGKDGYIRAGDLKIGDEVESDLGYGVVSYIEYKQQPKFLIATANRIAPVSDTHQFIDGEGNIVLASELTIGSLVNTDEGIEEITFIGEPTVGEVIDITVEGTHQYYANGFLSHNKPCFSYAGWATSSEACTYWGTLSWSLWSSDNPIVAGSKLYGSSTGGAAPPICSTYPYLFSNYLNKWILVTQAAPEYDFDVVAIDTCTVTVIITAYVPYSMTCFSSYSFAAAADYTLDTTVTAEVIWYGDLGGAITQYISIPTNTACNTSSFSTGSAINCLGEYYSSDTVTLDTYSYGSQTYTIGSTVVGGVYPC